MTSHAHQPPHWTPMDLSEVECKLMEVRKYSADYFDVDTRFRRPGMELITVYHVQVSLSLIYAAEIRLDLISNCM